MRRLILRRRWSRDSEAGLRDGGIGADTKSRAEAAGTDAPEEREKQS
jgi:hypothetical protein